jgi:hypothetical protein
MPTQRELVSKSILIPDHGVYPIRVPKEEVPKEREVGEKWNDPEVPDVDYGEW